MKQKYFDELTQEQIQALKQMGEVGSLTAAHTISHMIENKILLSLSRINLLPLNQVPEYAGGEEQPVVGIYHEIMGEAEGHILFIIPKKDARHLFQLVFMSGEEEISKLQLSENEKSLLCELGNILSTSYLAALTGFTRMALYPSRGAATVDSLAAVVSSTLATVANIGDKVIFLETNFVIGDHRISTYYFIIPTPQSLQEILQRLGV